MANEHLMKYREMLYVLGNALRLVEQYRNPNITISDQDQQLLNNAFQIVDDELENVTILLEVTE